MDNFPNEETLKRMKNGKIKQLITEMLTKDRRKRIRINELIEALEDMKE